MRRRLIALAAAALTASPVAGCGGGHHRVAHGAVCGYSAWRATHDARAHHFAFAAFQAYLAAHHCPRALHRR